MTYHLCPGESSSTWLIREGWLSKLHGDDSTYVEAERCSTGELGRPHGMEAVGRGHSTGVVNPMNRRFLSQCLRADTVSLEQADLMACVEQVR
jgi:hypothetical protein